MRWGSLLKAVVQKGRHLRQPGRTAFDHRDAGALRAAATHLGRWRLPKRSAELGAGLRRMEDGGGQTLGLHQRLCGAAQTLDRRTHPFDFAQGRLFAWIGNCRRTAKDYEHNPKNSETIICLTMIHLML